MRATVQHAQANMGRRAIFHRSLTSSGGSCRRERFRAHRCSRRAARRTRRSEARATRWRAAASMTVAARSAAENLLGWAARLFRARTASSRCGWMCEMLSMSCSSCNWIA
jgi:hypothetical protein